MLQMYALSYHCSFRSEEEIVKGGSSVTYFGPILDQPLVFEFIIM